LPTDRLIAEWWIRSKRVESLVNTGKLPQYTATTKVEVPTKIYEWKASPTERTKAAEVQLRNREMFLKAFDDDLAVLRYERDAAGNGAFLLGPWDEDWSYASQ